MQDGDLLKPLVQRVVQELLEAEMDDTLGTAGSQGRFSTEIFER